MRGVGTGGGPPTDERLRILSNPLIIASILLKSAILLQLFELLYANPFPSKE
jgi:hypothetical protein